MDKIFMLMDDLLNASKFNQGQIHLKKAPFNLVKMVDNCCQQYHIENLYPISIKGDAKLKFLRPIPSLLLKLMMQFSLLTPVKLKPTGNTIAYGHRIEVCTSKV